MKFWNEIKQQKWFPYTVAAVVGVGFYMLLNHISILLNLLYGIWTIVKPLLYGFVLAYLIDPIARFYENKPFSKIKRENVKRNISVIFGVITVVVVFGLLAAAIIPSLIRSITNIFETFGDFVQNVDKNAGHISSNLPFGLGTAISNFSISETVLDSMSEFVTNNLQSIADTSVTIGSGFANFIIAFVLAIYYMMDKDRLQMMGKRIVITLFHEKRYTYIYDTVKRADKILLQYIKGNLLEALLVGIANAVFMLIAQLPYVLLISIVIGITNIAPTFGPIVGAVIGAIMLVLVNPWYALVFLIFTVILQTVDGYILKPKLFGETLGVSPLLILIMIILGGRLCGVVGIILAIPVAAIAQFLADDFWKKHKEKKAQAIIEKAKSEHDQSVKQSNE